MDKMFDVIVVGAGNGGLAAAANTAPAGSWTCECGSVNTGKFCGECGKPAQKKEWFCTECGAKNTGKFCSECGKARG